MNSKTRDLIVEAAKRIASNKTNSLAYKEVYEYFVYQGSIIKELIDDGIYDKVSLNNNIIGRKYCCYLVDIFWEPR